MIRVPRAPRRRTIRVGAALLALAGCSGGEESALPPTTTPPPPPAAVSPLFRPELRNLSAADVERIIAQAVDEARARSSPATIAVVDRVGNVLAVFRMTGADATLDLPAGPTGTNTALQGIANVVPSTLGAISKAITGAYLSSGGNAFSSRTASQIVQEHFPPAPTTVGLESGPLFGVQFSQLPCSDLSARFSSGGPRIGPQRAPLGLAADPGGFPLYKDGFVVGGVGVIADGVYGFDPNTLDFDQSLDEVIALAATTGFEAPQIIRAERIAVDGTTLRYSDAASGDFASNPASAPSFAAINGVRGSLVDVTAYFDGATMGGVFAGVSYGAEASGVRPATPGEYANSDVFVLTNGAGANRYPPIGGTDGATLPQPLTAAEVRTILEEAFTVMTAARGQIRQPLNSRAQVTISVVDTNGAILGILRGPDAPMFGTDVSLQKARTAAFFSGEDAATDLLGTSAPALTAPPLNQTKAPASYVADVRTFIPDPTALTGDIAFSDRANGNLSRPFFPDGEIGTANGPLSLPITQWSVFATGLQTSLIIDNILTHVVHVLGGGADTAQRCTALPDVASVPGVQNRLQNGIQIFPGSVPIYRGSTLIGGIGVSGDGIDQDDMISFLGLHRAGERLGTVNNAAPGIRADRIVINVNGGQVRLRYVNCPFTPFVGSNEQNVCEGK